MAESAVAHFRPLDRAVGRDLANEDQTLVAVVLTMRRERTRVRVVD